jgi:RNA polymerase sigma-54 factor
MALKPRLELRQTQSLVMTPQLRQALKMLQMSTLELGGFLAEQIEANPLIEIADGLEPAERPAPAAGERAAVDSLMAREDLSAAEAPFETGRENLYEAGEGGGPAPDGPGRGAGAGGAAARDPLDDEGAAALPDRPSLSDHVRAQLALARLPRVARLVAEALAGELDEAGYLRVDDAETALRLGVGPEVVAAARAAIHACEPTGVGARSLAECLALQLAERDRLDPAMAALIDGLDLLTTLSADAMAARCGVSREDFDDMLAELRRLDPRPGLRWGGGGAAPGAPDILATPDGAGGWRVELNPDALPKLLIDRSYAARVNPARSREARLFLADCAQTASWLKKSLDQRARTILTVAAEVARAQAGFLERGATGMKPLTLRQVAETVGLHESTVSRVVANKVVATPRGLFELRFFFASGVAAADGGEAVSARAVCDHIRRLVAAEPPGRPLSDDALVKALRAEGVEVARRTVAKYRESLRIPSSIERRRRASAAI